MRLGADAVGYTLYVGSPKQEDDFIQLGKVRQDCDRFGMPLVIWAYPRGRDIEKKGGQTSLYAIDYAARVAMEMGADIVKLNMPKPGPREGQGLTRALQRARGHAGGGDPPLRQSAGRALVVLSGGSKVDDDKLLEQTRMIMEAGGSGVIFGRNVWQREWGQALGIIEQIKDTLLKSRTRIP